MAFDFPNAPTVGDTYLNYTWDGEKWTSSTGQGVIYVSDTPPSAPAGSLWFESDTGSLYVRFADANSTQWVMLTTGSTALVKKNYVINGAMMVSQEWNGAVRAYIGDYAVDMFAGASTSAGVCNFQQVASRSPAGSPNRLRITVTTPDATVDAGDVTFYYTCIEGVRFADLKFGTASAKTITIQFGVKAPAGTYTVGVMSGGNRGYIAPYVITASEANTDVVKSVTIPGDVTGTWGTGTASADRVEIRWMLMAGTDYHRTPNVWVTGQAYATSSQFNFFGTLNNVFELFDVSLTEGTVAPPFIVPDYVTELDLCRRYFQISNPSPGFFHTTAEFITVIPLVGSMRPFPTIVVKISAKAVNTMFSEHNITSLSALGGSDSSTWLSLAVSPAGTDRTTGFLGSGAFAFSARL